MKQNEDLMNKSKKTQAQIEREMKDELRKQGIDVDFQDNFGDVYGDDDDCMICLLYTSPSPRDRG